MRTLDAAFKDALSAGVIVPAYMVSLTFVAGVQYVWSGVGSLVYGGNTYIGVGSLGKVGTITEGINVRADGTSVSLSGIDATLYADTMADIQLGGAAKIYFALLNQGTGTVIGAPYLLFSGLVDKPTISEGADTIDITLQLESRMTNLQRASNIRYDAATQRQKYPTDSAFDWVEQLNDAQIAWGTS